MSSDPLDRVFGELEELDQQRRAQLASLIAPFAKIHAESGRVAFLPGAQSDLSPVQKITVLLLSRLALSTRNPAHPPSLSPKDIETELDMPGGTVRPKLGQLVKSRVIVKEPTGTYSIRPSGIARAKTILSELLPKEETG